jgi:hypothetical protein
MKSAGGTSSASDAWLRAALLAAAAGTLGCSVHLLNGRLVLSESSAPAQWLLATVILTIVAVLAPLPRVSRSMGMTILSIVGFICLAANIAQLCQRSIADLNNIQSFADYSPFTISLGVFGLSVGVAFAASGIMRHIMVGVVLISFALLGTLILRNGPPWAVDVFVFQHDSLAALERGNDPYAINFPDVYEGKSAWYGPGMSLNGVLQFGYPYMPLTLLMNVSGQWVMGDFRYAELAACIVAAGLMAYASADIFGLLAALIFLTMPRIFYVLQLGWNEPLVVVLLAAVVFCAVRSPRALPYLLGLFLASKQYLPAAAAMAFLLIPTRGRNRREIISDYGRMLVKAAIVAAIVTLPLILWNPAAFWKSAITLQIHQPYRPDSLSFLAWYAKDELKTPALQAVAFVVLAAAIVLTLWRCPHTPAGFAAAVALSYLLFFAFNKQAFANYYFFVIGALCCAISALGKSVRSSTS